MVVKKNTDTDDYSEIKVAEIVKDYPALKIISKITNFIAWLIVILSIIAFIILLSTNSYLTPGTIFLYFWVGALGTFISFIFWKAISEILILFVDIAQDVTNIKIEKKNMNVAKIFDRTNKI